VRPGKGVEDGAHPAESVASARKRFDYLIRTVLKPCERFICKDHDFEDRRQEGLGRACSGYSRRVALGHEPDIALVVHAARLAMVNRDHSLSGHEHRPRHDVYIARDETSSCAGSKCSRTVTWSL